MNDLTVETIETPEGYDFVRSDGQCFFLVAKENGAAVLYAGHRGKAPAVNVVGFERSVADKLEAAREHVLAFRETGRWAMIGQRKPRRRRGL